MTTEVQPNSQPRDTRMLEMELEMLKREIELLKIRSPMTNSACINPAANARASAETRLVQSKINVNTLAELPEFDDTGDFHIWQNHLRLLKEIYQSDVEHTRILIGLRLRGKALAWLHSKTEHMELSVEDLR